MAKKAYKVSLFYYLQAEDQADALQQALAIKLQEGPIELHRVSVTLRTKRCCICERLYTANEMRIDKGEDYHTCS